jgi:outer membrane protein OmpA-like peptidoglycan-associated protein
MKYLSFILILVLALQLKAQHADCNNALLLEDTIYHTEAITGFGNRKEFDGNHLEDKKLFEEEANSIWYVIDIKDPGVFTFDIITDNENDDWDFLLYVNQPMFCGRLNDKLIKPIRSNLSRSPITGLSLTSEERFVSAGVNNNYSKAINVEKGDQYVLIVNNPKTQGGKHTLVLHHPKKKLQKPKEVKPVQPTNTTAFKMEILDAETKKPVIGFASVDGLKRTIVDLKNVSKYEHIISKKNRTVNIEAYAKGYMLLSKEYKVGKTKSKFKAKVLLEKIEPGKKVNLTKIQFYGDQFNLLPSAKPSLEALLSFMKQNPSISIEIEGHVNGPGERNTKRYKELSYNRAYAVKADLVKNGIAKDRIDFKGYGNSQMLYPVPKSVYQESANRRVEIKIVTK